jgi:hypothetical protein
MNPQEPKSLHLACVISIRCCSHLNGSQPHPHGEERRESRTIVAYIASFHIKKNRFSSHATTTFLEHGIRKKCGKNLEKKTRDTLHHSVFVLLIK